MSQQYSSWQPTRTAGFQGFVATELLSERPPRAADPAAENCALRALARQLAGPPAALLQRLVDIALNLCCADTAGVSLLEAGSGGTVVFRRVALAGADAHHVDTTAPAESSGCGFALRRNAAQLYTYANGYHAHGDIHFPAVVEKLVIPFPPNGDPFGTIWVATHDTARRFDAEDVRILQSLADFTAAALQLSLTAKENARLSEQTEQQLQQQHERLRLLWETAAAALTTNDPPTMLHTLMQRVGPPLGIDAYFNHLLSESGDGLRLESYAGVPEDATRDVRWLPLRDAAGDAATSSSPSIADALRKAQQTPLAVIESLEARAYACYPLLADENRLLGTLSFFGRARLQFQADELEFLDTISRYVSIAYERLRLMKELRVSDRRKDEFLATLAHELRNPLAPIRNGLQLIGAPALNTEALGRVRAMMDRQLAQMVRLIDDLLDVSRITRGKIELRKQRIELATVLTSAAETARPLIESLGHELLIMLPQQPVPLDADLTRLAQVFMNLLNNAAKYTESGGRIEVEAAVQDSDVMVSVRDNGIGISAEVLPNVFELFVQGDRSLERAQGGLGIGLTLVKRLVEMHGGSVQAKSEGIGHGAEFKVRLPLATARTSEGQTGTMRTTSPGNRQRRRILIADDNLDAAESLATLLGLDGDEVRVAHDGLEAVELEEHFAPDVVVLDIGMPALNGYDAARLIRARGSKALLIALTGWGQENDKRSSREAGFDFHLVKPAEPETLRALLQQAGSADTSDPFTSTP
ncbi:MAG TPA: ATP-binding protein [Burkholderiales bacterium]